MAGSSLASTHSWLRLRRACRAIARSDLRAGSGVPNDLAMLEAAGVTATVLRVRLAGNRVAKRASWAAVTEVRLADFALYDMRARFVRPEHRRPHVDTVS